MSVDQQRAVIADLDRESRNRSLSSHESDLLADLIRRADRREYWRRRRLDEQLDRARSRLFRLRERMI